MTTATGNGKQESDGVSDKKKDSAALKRIRDTIGNHMKTPEFQKSSVECLEYAPNEFELDAVLRSNADISEPWVRPNYSTKKFRQEFQKNALLSDVRHGPGIRLGHSSLLEILKKKGMDSLSSESEESSTKVRLSLSCHSLREGKKISL